MKEINTDCPSCGNYAVLARGEDGDCDSCGATLTWRTDGEGESEKWWLHAASTNTAAPPPPPADTDKMGGDVVIDDLDESSP